jgi:hypothetical protein
VFVKYFLFILKVVWLSIYFNKKERFVPINKFHTFEGYFPQRCLDLAWRRYCFKKGVKIDHMLEVCLLNTVSYSNVFI